MKNVLVVGGNSGLGLSLVCKLLKNCERVYIVGKDEPDVNERPQAIQNEFSQKTSFKKVNLINADFSFLNGFEDIDTLIITAGFGRVAPFEDLMDVEVYNLLRVNCEAAIRIIKKYYSKIKSDKAFYTAVIGSIAGHVSSPLFSVYGAAKSALCRFVENVNEELEASGVANRILDVSPGALQGTRFNGASTDLEALNEISAEIIERMERRERFYIPKYDEVYKSVIERYNENPQKFALDSYKYKIEGGRVNDKPQVIVGYLSGTFDLFHVGHLNLLRRAKEQCDYLIVGVHKSGSWKGKETFIPFEERCAILESVRYVDRVVESPTEDSDAWDMFRYDRLFVGSDYQGSERFARYEKYLEGKAKIIYFPYTQGTSSTKLRAALESKTKND